MKIRELNKYGIKLLFLATVLFVFHSNTFSQPDLPTHENEAIDVFTYELEAMRILDIEGTAPSLHLIQPTEAGSAVSNVSVDLSWINYTSIVAEGLANKITVVLSNLPPNFTTLKVEASVHTGTGDGIFGTKSTQLTLVSTSAAQDIITAIGSCWTGDGIANGHKLTYTWGITPGVYEDATSIAASSDVTIMYTIIAAN